MDAEHILFLLVTYGVSQIRLPATACRPDIACNIDTVALVDFIRATHLRIPFSHICHILPNIRLALS